MKKYLLAIMTQVEVDAPELSDAKDIVEEFFGEGAFGTLEVISYEICDEEELT